MIKTIRQILLTEYIGAILIALLGWEASIVLISTLLRDLLSYCYRSRSRGVLGDTPSSFTWDGLVFSVVSAALYLLLAYLLARWLYPAAQPSQPAAPSPEGGEQQ